MFPNDNRVNRRWPAAAGAAVLAGLLATVVLLHPPREAAAQPPAAAAADDLALVPADAAGFVHVRLADLWKNDLFAQARKTWERAGEKAIATLDKQFVPAPSSLDRVTAFVLFDRDRGEPQPFGIVTFSAPFDRAQLVKVYLPDAKERKVGGKTVYTSDRMPDLAVHFPDDRHVVVGMDEAMDGYLSKPVAKDGPMAPALKLAATRPVVAAANVAALPIPPGALDELPADVRPILKAEQLVFSVDLGERSKLELRASYKDAAAAQDADKAVRALVDVGRKELAKQRKELEDKLYDPKIETPRPPDQLPEAIGSVFALGALGRVDDLLADEKLVTRDGNDLTFSAELPRELAAIGGLGVVGIGLALPAVQKVREAAARASSANNLKQIGIAIHSYHDANNRFPEDIKDKNGKPILSWRVAILPYIEQDALYRQFKLDEPWDSEHNKKLSQLRIQTFVSPNTAPVAEPADSYGLTNYKGIAGPGTIFDPKGKLTIANVADGTSNTVMVVETADAIPWAKPGDYPFDPDKPLPKITPVRANDIVQMLMADGSVRAVNMKLTGEKKLKAAFTRAGGEVSNLDD